VIKAGKDFDTGRTVVLPIPGAGGAHWVVGGSTGSGKTQFIHSVIAQLARLENTAIVISDPAFMDLEPVWGKRASCVALGRQGAGWLLDQLERELQWRLRYGRKIGVAKLQASPATPRIVAIFDELAMVTLGGVKNATNRLIDVAMVARKIEIGLVLGTNSPKATVLPRLVTEQCPVRVAFRTEEPEQTDAILSTQRVKAHDISFSNPGEMYVRMPSGGFSHPKAAYESEDFYKQVAADTAHLAPVLPASRGWMPLYDPYEQGEEGDD
jgi:DNA segregation ATPase FtsK/SpoIIIE, S-DNA-T family